MSPLRVPNPPARWWMTGDFYYGTESDVKQEGATKFGTLENSGTITTVLDERELGYVDERGEFFSRDNQPLHSKPKFSDPNKYFWIKDPENGFVGQLLRKGSSNSDLRTRPKGSPYQNYGPETASEASGWCWNPLEQIGEPITSMMILRQLNGQPIPWAQWERVHGSPLTYRLKELPQCLPRRQVKHSILLRHMRP